MSIAGVRPNSAKRKSAWSSARLVWARSCRSARSEAMTTQHTLASTLFGEAPARDGRFQVKEQWRALCNLPAGHPEKTTEFLHRQMNEELNSLEISARALADFPQAPWE